MTNVSVERQNFDLTNSTAAELEKLWRLHLSEKVPDHLPKSLLAKLLAYRLQEQQRGGLSKRAITYLKAIEIDLRNGNVPEAPYPEEQRLKPGCQLLREHGGIDHRVTVLEGGYQWNSKTYPSLSSVAKAITGTNWNGHRFFGLKTKVPSSAEVVS
ncbi:MAG: DUF2924 domain-containing protein [Pseudomonadota bacterium]|nr:DUF2924 domain-containing protein [Pseudomonadota bacterium]